MSRSHACCSLSSWAWSASSNQLAAACMSHTYGHCMACMRRHAVMQYTVCCSTYCMYRNAVMQHADKANTVQKHSCTAKCAGQRAASSMMPQSTVAVLHKPPALPPGCCGSCAAGSAARNSC
jgi:hypothetical protein